MALPRDEKIEATVTVVTGFAPLAYVRSEWEILKKSKTVKGLITMEALAVGTFVEQVIGGEQALTFDALKGWIVLQGALIVAFLLRQAFAGIEAQLDGRIPPAIVQHIEAKVQDKAVEALVDRGHVAAANTLAQAFTQEKGA